MLENLRLSFQGIWSHKMRSFLTMLGIIIGIAAIIAIVSTIKGTNEQIEQNLIGAGDNNVTEDFLNAAIEEMKRRYGDTDTYLQRGIGLTKEERKRLQDILLTDN